MGRLRAGDLHSAALEAIRRDLTLRPRQDNVVKLEIQPPYKKATITCACKQVVETYSSVGDYHVDVCSNCHPFFTGKQKLLDTAGRVDRFRRKYAKKKAG